MAVRSVYSRSGVKNVVCDHKRRLPTNTELDFGPTGEEACGSCVNEVTVM